jgi:radical SAM-linked protein
MPHECRFLLRFRLLDDLRFVSHLDLMRLFERACRRAGLPLKFSQGFNPRPAVNLPVPHAVGVAGADEPLLIELTEPRDPAVLTAELNAQLPAQAQAASARGLEPGEKLRPEWAEYRVQLPPDAETIDPAKAAALMAGDSIAAVRRRNDGKPEKPLEIRRFVLELRTEVKSVFMRLAVTDSGSARPGEVMQALGVAEDVLRRAEIVRTAVHLRSELRPAQKPGGSDAGARRAEEQTECSKPTTKTESEPGDGSGGAETDEAVEIDGRTGGTPALPDC